MGSWIFLLFLLVYWIDAERRRVHRTVHASFFFTEITVEIRIGTPERLFMAVLDNAIPYFVIMDAACKEPRREISCPRYCGDYVSRSALCNPLCEPVSQSEAIVRCFTQVLYHSNLSTTFGNLGEFRTARFRSRRPLYGRLARERISLISQLKHKAQNFTSSEKRRNVVQAEEAEFIRGLSYDYGKLYGTSAILGLAPGSPSRHPAWIPELKATGALDRALVTIQKPNPPVFASFFQHIQTHYALIFGGLDGYHCRNWRRFPTHDGFDWNFRISTMVFAGLLINGTNVGRIDLVDGYITVPRRIVQHFVAQNFVTVDRETKHLHLTDHADPKMVMLEFTVGNQRISMDTHWLRPFPDSKILALREGESSRYSDEPRWGFGIDLLNYLCFGYDYDEGAVLWAERRFIRINGDYGYE